MIRLSHHATLQALRKGISLDAVLRAANNPSVTYPSRIDGQHRHIHGDVCAVVDRARDLVITLYVNVVETPLRPDQVA